MNDRPLPKRAIAAVNDCKWVFLPLRLGENSSEHS